jgi:hypothetical protein
VRVYGRLLRAPDNEGTLREHQHGHGRPRPVTRPRSIPPTSGSSLVCVGHACPPFPPRCSMVRRGRCCLVERSKYRQGIDHPGDIVRWVERCSPAQTASTSWSVLLRAAAMSSGLDPLLCRPGSRISVPRPKRKAGESGGAWSPSLISRASAFAGWRGHGPVSLDRVCPPQGSRAWNLQRARDLDRPQAVA